MSPWILSQPLQTWIRVAQRDNSGRVSAFDYAANTTQNTVDGLITFVPKGSRGFQKLLKAYFMKVTCSQCGGIKPSEQSCACFDNDCQ